MVFLNYSTMEMVAKIVYYGPGLGGKTTNLKTIYQKTSPQSRGEMVSLATETDRTLFFDLLPMEVGVIGGFKTKFQLYTVPGQVFYNTTRKLVLRGVDGIVFVADSQVPMMDANIESFQNLKENLAEINLTIEDIPIVLQYNKRDIPNILSLEALDNALNPHGFVSVEASALNGVGVFETLREISKQTLMLLNNRDLKGKPESRPKSKAKPAAATPAPAAPAPAQAPVATAMPEDVSFDDLGDIAKETMGSTSRTHRDSFEQTLNNLDLNLSDDDDPFLEEDSLEVEEFDHWDEDSLESSLDDLADDTSPGSLGDDYGEVRTLQMGRIGDNEPFADLHDTSLEETANAALVLDDENGSFLQDEQDDYSEPHLDFHGDLDHHLDAPTPTADLEDIEWHKEELDLEVDDLDLDELRASEEPTVTVDRNLIPGIGDELPLEGFEEESAAHELDEGFDLDVPLGDTDSEELDDTPSGTMPFDSVSDDLAEIEGLAADLEALDPTLSEKTEPDTSDHSNSDLDYSLDHGLDMVLSPQTQGVVAPEPEVPTELDPSLESAFGGDLEVLEEPEFVATPEHEDPADFDFDQAGPSLDFGDQDEEAYAAVAEPTADTPTQSPLDTLPPADEPGFEDELDFDMESELGPDLITDEGDTLDRYEFPEAAVGSEENGAAFAPDAEDVPAFEPDPELDPMNFQQEVTSPTLPPQQPAARPIFAETPAAPTPIIAPPSSEAPRTAPPRKTNDSLEELKRMTTRIQTSKLPGKKKSSLDDLITGLASGSEKKAHKCTLQVSKPIYDAQLNCVLVDEFQNVVHAELIKVKPRKTEEGHYQIQITIDIELEP